MALASKTRSLRSTQLMARVPRMLVFGTCVVLQAVGMLAILSDGPPANPAPGHPTAAPTNARAEAIAEGFARAYLTWDPEQSRARTLTLKRLAPSVAAEEAEAPVAVPQRSLTVQWTAVADDQASGDGRRITVIAQTSAGLTALVVDTQTSPSGAVAVTGYPSVVGVPPTAAATASTSGDAIEDEALRSTVIRALGNFLRARRSDLTADVLPGASIAVPDEPMRPVGIDDMTWTNAGHEMSVLARARWQDGELRLRYAVGVVRQAGRWFISWIGTPQHNTRRSP